MQLIQEFKKYRNPGCRNRGIQEFRNPQWRHRTMLHQYITQIEPAAYKDIEKIFKIIRKCIKTIEKASKMRSMTYQAWGIWHLFKHNQICARPDKEHRTFARLKVNRHSPAEVLSLLMRLSNSSSAAVKCALTRRQLLPFHPMPSSLLVVITTYDFYWKPACSICQPSAKRLEMRMPCVNVFFYTEAVRPWKIHRIHTFSICLTEGESLLIMGFACVTSVFSHRRMNNTLWSSHTLGRNELVDDRLTSKTR